MAFGAPREKFLAWRETRSLSEVSVWAPRAGSVEVVLGEGRRIRAVPGRGHDRGCHVDADVAGWWWIEQRLEPGVDYRFSLDGGPLLPDPRSQWQPEGPHGPSRDVDHATYRWNDGAWRGVDLAGSSIYEAHVGTFTPAGTFRSMEEKLDHLVELGVDIVELMPLSQFPGRWGWGYDGVDLYAPHNSYGDPDSLKHLVDTAHAKGLGVFLDVVYNHLGPDGNYLESFGPYFTDRYSTPWGKALNLDGPGSDQVRSLLIGSALNWLEHYHFDGLRLDAVHAIVDTSALHFLEQLAREVSDLGRRLGRKLWLVAESDLNDPRLVRPAEAGGYGLDAQWSDDFHHALWGLVTGERSGYYADFGQLSQLSKALTGAFVFDGDYSQFRGRRHGRPIGDLPPERFLAYDQNHDQIGNRAKGERMSALVPADRVKLSLGMVLTSPFVPMLFQGEEWAASTPFTYFTDHTDPALGAAVSQGRRQEFAAFGWDPSEVPDPQDPATFRRSLLCWEELAEPPHADVWQWCRLLLRLRRELPWITAGRVDPGACTTIGQHAIVVHRDGGAIAANFGTETVRVGAEAASAACPPTVVASSPGSLRIEDGFLTLPADGFAVVSGPLRR